MEHIFSKNNIQLNQTSTKGFNTIKQYYEYLDPAYVYVIDSGTLGDIIHTVILTSNSVSHIVEFHVWFNTTFDVLNIVLDRDNITHKMVIDNSGVSPKKLNKIVEELGDVIWYINLMIHTINTSWEEVLIINNEKLSKRYPNGKFDSLQSEKRVDMIKL